MRGREPNIDTRVVTDFGEEWDAYARAAPGQPEHRRLFGDYFSLFPFESLPPGAEGFDLGCGSGRWAEFVAPRVGRLHCVDPAAKALESARARLSGADNVRFHQAGVDDLPLADGSQDFGYAIGVLHHIPDTGAALAACARKLKPGAPMLVYLYYRFDDKPRWFVRLWRVSDLMRRGICRLPFRAKRAVTDLMAAGVYWPLARLARLAERLGRSVADMPLSSYRAAPFRTMRNDALDRFGTRLEQRFTRPEIEAMMRGAGLDGIVFREAPPYWVAIGRRTSR